MIPIQLKMQETPAEKSNGTILGTIFFKNLGKPHKVVLFVGNSRKYCSIHCCKFPEIHAEIFSQMESAQSQAKLPY